MGGNFLIRSLAVHHGHDIPAHASGCSGVTEGGKNEGADRLMWVVNQISLAYCQATVRWRRAAKNFGAAYPMFLSGICSRLAREKSRNPAEGRPSHINTRHPPPSFVLPYISPTPLPPFIPFPVLVLQMRWPRLFGQIFRFDKWNIRQGLGRQADRRQALCSVVGLIGRHAVKARVRAAAIVQRGLRTPTGPFFAGFSIRIIRGRADRSACAQRSRSLMTFFSAARWKVRKRIDGWRSQPGCSIAPDVLNRRP
jgi:hypothetical protein